jgi:hypothetical protein
MPVQRACTDASLLGNLIEARLRPKAREGILGDLQNPVAIPFRIGARLSWGRLGTFRSHEKKFATGGSLR